MTSVFADTSYFLALLAPSDEAHERAVVLSSRLRDPIITTHWVVMELGNALSAQADRALFHQWLAAMNRDDRAEVVPATEEILARAIGLHSSRQDKDWSLTDCTSFVVMRERGTTDALTTDHHFTQAGFRILL